MIEIPEAIVLSKQIEKQFINKKLIKVYPPTNLHKFAFFSNKSEDYDRLLSNRVLTKVENHGALVVMYFETQMFYFCDGTIPLYIKSGQEVPKKYQMLFEFNNGDMLSFGIAMYGCLLTYDIEHIDNKYYDSSTNKVNALDERFTIEYFNELIEKAEKNYSLKAFLATEQRIPGIGNGVLQDILFRSQLNPKTLMSMMTKNNWVNLYNNIISVLSDMVSKGGRDTEKDLYGNNGNYKTILSKNTYNNPCPICEGKIVKEAYLGGSVYYCPNCQKKEIKLED